MDVCGDKIGPSWHTYRCDKCQRELCNSCLTVLEFDYNSPYHDSWYKVICDLCLLAPDKPLRDLLYKHLEYVKAVETVDRLEDELIACMDKLNKAKP